MIQAPATAAALTGIRVLDLTTNYAAYAGRLLADLGADVVRVEPPEGSPLRSLAPCQTGPTGAPLSFAHAFLDAGKRSVTLDLMTAAGRELLAELAASSDAMIETPSAAAADHIDFDARPPAQPGSRAGVDIGVRPRRTLCRISSNRPDTARGRRAAVARRLCRQRAARCTGRAGDAGIGHLRRDRGAHRALRAHANRQGLLDRCVGAGMRGVRARRRGGGMVDQCARASPPGRRRARGRHRGLSLQGRPHQHGGGPSRHRQCVRHVDAVGRRLRGAGRSIVARAAMAGFQIPPVAGGDRSLCRDLRRLLPDARQAGALSRRSGPPDRDCAGQHRGRRPAGRAACGELVFPTAIRAQLGQGASPFPARPIGSAARPRAHAAPRRSSASTIASLWIGSSDSPPARAKLERTRCSLRV